MCAPRTMIMLNFDATALDDSSLVSSGYISKEYISCGAFESNCMRLLIIMSILGYTQNNPLVLIILAANKKQVLTPFELLIT